jgi:hypothetical protein
MAIKRLDYPIEPMDLGNMRANGAVARRVMLANRQSWDGSGRCRIFPFPLNGVQFARTKSEALGPA